jgi:hypothetical protein
MYATIERLICGKICGLASCRVLSRSKSQTGADALSRVP